MVNMVNMILSNVAMRTRCVGSIIFMKSLWKIQYCQKHFIDIADLQLVTRDHHEPKGPNPMSTLFFGVPDPLKISGKISQSCP